MAVSDSDFDAAFPSGKKGKGVAVSDADFGAAFPSLKREKATGPPTRKRGVVGISDDDFAAAVGAPSREAPSIPGPKPSVRQFISDLTMPTGPAKLEEPKPAPRPAPPDLALPEAPPPAAPPISPEPFTEPTMGEAHTPMAHARPKPLGGEPPITLAEWLDSPEARENIPAYGIGLTAFRYGDILTDMAMLKEPKEEHLNAAAAREWEKRWDRYRRERRAASGGPLYWGGDPDTPSDADIKEIRGEADFQYLHEIRYGAAETRVKKLVARLNEEQERGFTFGAEVGRTVSMMPNFMLEFATSGGFAKITSSAVRQGASKLFGRWAQKQGIRTFIKGLGWVGGAAARTTFMPERIIKGAVERRLPYWSVDEEGRVLVDAQGDDPGRAFLHAFGDVIIENMSEVAGAKISKYMTKGAGKLFAKAPRLKDALSNVTERLRPLMGGGLLTKAGYHGVIEEMAEERLGDLMRATVGLQSWEQAVPAFRQLGVELASFSVPGVVAVGAERLTPPAEAPPPVPAEEVLPAPEAPPVEVAPVPEAEVVEEAPPAPAPPVEATAEELRARIEAGEYFDADYLMTNHPELYELQRIMVREEQFGGERAAPPVEEPAAPAPEVPAVAEVTPAPVVEPRKPTEIAKEAKKRVEHAGEPAELRELPYKDLQARARELGVKAIGRRSAIIAAIQGAEAKPTVEAKPAEAPAPAVVPKVDTFSPGLGMQGREAVERANWARLKELERLQDEGHERVQIGARTMPISRAVEMTERRISVMPLQRLREAEVPPKPAEKRALVPVSRLEGKGIEYVSPDTLDMAVADWQAGRLYVDNNGNYHLKREGRSRGPIAPYNKELKARGVTPNDLQAYGTKVAPEAKAEEAPERAEPKPKPKPKKAGATAGGGMAAAVEGAGYGTIANREGDDKAGRPTPKLVPISEQKGAAEAVRGVNARRVRLAVDQTLKAVAPAHRGAEAKRAARIITKDLAEAAQRDAALRHELRKARRAFWFMSREDQLDFIYNMEDGTKQASYKLDTIAAAGRKVLDGLRGEVQALGKGKLEQYIQDYFPHIWKNPSKARSVIAGILGKRPLEGRKAFLKRRSIMSTKEGVEEYGLEPVSHNPIDLILLKAHEMNRYIMAQNMIRDLKEATLIKFVYERSQNPEGYVRVDDNLFTVYAPPEMSIKEAYDQLYVDSLMALAQSLGIDAQRFMKLGGKRWGYHEPGQVRTKFAGPESVLIHEIGHELGERYNLYEWMRRKGEGEYKTITRGEHKGEKKFVPSRDAVEHRKMIDAEWRAVADARYESLAPGDTFRKYVRKAEEKEAVLLEALLHAPDKMQEVAPNVLELFKKFLNDHAELRPLLDIKPSLTLGVSRGVLKVPGVTTLGHYAAPEPVATLLNNYLSPGLRGSRNQLIGGGYDLGRKGGNVLNQAQLSASAFHAIMTSASVAASQVGQGIRNLATLSPRLWARAVRQIVTAPIAPFTTAGLGWYYRKAGHQVLDQITDPNVRSKVESIIQAGGRVEADSFYFNNAVRRLEKTLSEMFKAQTLGRRFAAAPRLLLDLPQAALQLAISPILKWHVPNLKVGMFLTMAKDEMLRLKTEDVTDEVLWQRLRQVWDSVDNRLGLLIYDNLFWNKTMKDLFLIGFRATGWNAGFLREYAWGAPVDILRTPWRMKQGDALVSIRTAELLGTLMMMGGIGALMQYLLTGQPPDEEKDYFFPKTGHKNPDGSDERLNIPSYMKDIWAWGTRPGQTLKNKLHPMVTTALDVAQNEDFFGTKIRNEDDPLAQEVWDVAQYVGKQFVPFSVRNYGRMRESGATKSEAFWMSATGIHKAPGYITKSRAQKLASEYIVAKLPRGTRTKERYERSALKRDIRARLRLGRPIDWDEAKKTLAPSEILRIKRDARREPFALQFDHLSIEEALNVYVIATPQERAAVKGRLSMKMRNAWRRRRQTPHRDWDAMRKLYAEALKLPATVQSR